ncbi:MAG: cobyric acid synthase [Bryobacterales bacterium]|nr:cobyric acid synthase [Bryobacterales bacterium]
MSARAVMVVGTSSHAGKSWTATAICRSLRRRGLKVAPFKAQNMSNNACACPGGGEIGRAQAVQAEACGLDPEPDMNPILLKPTSASGSQVVVDGRVWRTLSARDYYEHFDFLLNRVVASYQRLAARFDFIVMEGAGSAAELNLRSRDLVNLGLARRLGVPALLVADIERGGVFASIIGTLSLLEEDDRALVRAFAVNRFRGDPSLFQDGVRILEQRTAKPCLGVFPYLDGVTIDAEDSVSLEDAAPQDGGPRVAILRLPRIANFTDFRLLPMARWISRPIAEPFDVVLLPGSKNTLGDLAWLREQRLDGWIQAQRESGACIAGVCGGYQMLGEWIDDPHGVESAAGGAPGLGLLPVRTVLAQEKTTRPVRAVTPAGTVFDAYEIHMGLTEVARSVEPFARHCDGTPDGARVGNCLGTYLHGAFEHPAVLREALGIDVAPPLKKAIAYDQLADWFEAHADASLFQEMFL